MRKTSIIMIIATLLCSCSKVEKVGVRQGWLCIESISFGRNSFEVTSSKGSVDSDFSVDILHTDGSAVPGGSYTAGTVPGKIALDAGEYVLRTASSNIDSWRTSFAGRGSAAYKAEEKFAIEADMYQYVRIQAPLVNYGVRFKTEDGLDKWFTSFSLSVTENASRNVTLSQMQEGWFDAQTVSVVLNATNTDGDSFSGKPYILHAEKGHLYTLNYELSPSEDGSLGFNVTIDDAFSSAGEELIIIGE